MDGFIFSVGQAYACSGCCELRMLVSGCELRLAYSELKCLGLSRLNDELRVEIDNSRLGGEECSDCLSAQAGLKRTCCESIL